MNAKTIQLPMVCGVILIIVGWSAAVAQAASIGINFVGSTSTGETLVPTDVAGVAVVAQDYWNNLQIGNGDGNGFGNTGALAAGTVIDSAGITDAGVAVTAGGRQGTNQSWRADCASWGFSGTNLTMMAGGIDGTPEVTVSGIPYASYDVYVYASNGAASGGGSATISVASGATGTVAAANTYFFEIAWTGGNFVQATATSSAQDTGATNYMDFAGNTATGFTLDCVCKATVGSGGGWAEITGVQIVATPEPSSLALLGLGGLLGLRGRRPRAGV
jgi:hypothetical protein